MSGAMNKRISAMSKEMGSSVQKGVLIDLMLQETGGCCVGGIAVHIFLPVRLVGILFLMIRAHIFMPPMPNEILFIRCYESITLKLMSRILLNQLQMKCAFIEENSGFIFGNLTFLNLLTWMGIK
ncbi:hypothetical protein C5167_047023 [Papaver somniferum]|uniref:Uncharacterized protein n=1 Tax=Papaver somniferum TaxID=3469 RepID=A0A4Y7LJE4_PAPSO|nr:hypothetical protein C5167_047023 [Papaver somniferum]